MNRVALIVGVGPGLGAALGRRLARGGFRVALVARSREFIDELARELHSLGQPSLALAADASQPAEIAAAVARVRAELGPIEVLVHNASASSEMLCSGQARNNLKEPGASPRSALSWPCGKPRPT